MSDPGARAGGSPRAASAGVPRWDEAAIVAAIADLARAHLEWTGELRPEQRLAQVLALDSLRRLTLVVEIENHFRIRLDPESEAGIETVGDLASVIRGKL
jgi:acyl carrier protein